MITREGANSKRSHSQQLLLLLLLLLLLQQVGPTPTLTTDFWPIKEPQPTKAKLTKPNPNQFQIRKAMQVQLQPKPLHLHLVFLPKKPKLFFPNSSTRTATCLRVSAAATTAATTGNMYELLSVRESAGLEEIKAAFRRLARKLHPDTCRSSEEEKERLTQQFIRAREAYKVLSDPDLRQDYDFRLKNGFASLNERSSSATRRQGFGDWESQLEALKRRSSVRHSSSWGCRMRARAAAAGN